MPAPTPTEPPASLSDSPRRPIARRGPVNFLLVAASVVVALYSSLGENQPRLLPLFISQFPATPDRGLIEVFHGEVWRLFTPAFIHFGIAHLGLNMLAMVNVGDPLERVLGSRFYLSFTALVALCSNVAQYLVSGSQYFGGMSGVIFGIFGFLWLRAWCDPEFVLRLEPASVVLTLVWFVFCFVGPLPIANTAHAVGLGIGVFWGIASGIHARQRARSAVVVQSPPPAAF